MSRRSHSPQRAPSGGEYSSHSPQRAPSGGEYPSHSHVNYHYGGYYRPYPMPIRFRRGYYGALDLMTIVAGMTVAQLILSSGGDPQVNYIVVVDPDTNETIRYNNDDQIQPLYGNQYLSMM